jgi:hypothetical protein
MRWPRRPKRVSEKAVVIYLSIHPNNRTPEFPHLIAEEKDKEKAIEAGA